MKIIIILSNVLNWSKMISKDGTNFLRLKKEEKFWGRIEGDNGMVLGKIKL